MNDVAAEGVANDFAARYEASWNGGPEAVAKLYTSDSVLVGFVTAIGRSEIQKLLQAIIGQGWTRIKIKILNVRKVGDVVLLVNEYTATGSFGENAGKTLTATASHVLVQTEGEWLSALHTAR
jgi:uncharacterized protein (TIGR02246 family)